MFAFEGYRSEFLKLLAQVGEEPALFARPRAPELALSGLLRACEAERNEMLQGPKLHLSALADQIGGDWSRLASLLADPESVAMLEALHVQLHTTKPAQINWMASDKAAL